MTEERRDNATGSWRQVSGSITGVVVGYVRVLLGDDGVQRVLVEAGEERPVSELSDDTQWSTYEQARRLFEAAAMVTGEPDVAWHIGAHLLNQHAGTEVAALLRSLGSTKELLRNVAATASKYSTVTTMDVVELHDDDALVAAVTAEPITRDPLFCRYTAGVLSQASVLFGHDPATVDELECQARGDARCLFRVRWATDDGDDPRRRIASLESQLTGLSGRFEALQATAAAFMTATSVHDVLALVTRRAGVAVRAPRFLLAVHLPSESGLRIHHEGFDTDEQAEAVAEDILSGTAADRATQLVVDVQSARAHFGVLAAIQPTGTPFFPQERQLLEAYAAHAAAALEVAAALEDARRQNETARALLAFGRSLAAVATTDLVVDRLVAALPSVVECDSGAVLLWDPDKGALRIQSTFGLAPGLDETFVGMQVRFEDTPALKVLVEERDPVFIDPSADDPFLRGLVEIAGMSSAAVVPILAHETVLGVVAVGRADDVFERGSDVMERLSGMADLAASAFVNARFLETVQTEALHDPLTGLANARLLARTADEALGGGAGSAVQTALLFLDLDGFKPVNDELGHEAGDEVLRICARRLRSAVRDGDTVARLGGDEFVVLMPVAGREAAEATARRLRDLLSRPFAVDGHELLLSASVGVALATGGDGFASLLRRADDAMYEMKPTRSARPRRAASTFTVEDLRADELDRLTWSGSRSHLRNVAGQLERRDAGVVDYLVVRDGAGTPVAKGGVDFEETVGAGTIFQLATHPDLEGRGHAQRLIAAAEDRIRGRGLDRARLSVEPENTRAVGLYEHLGYRAVGEREISWEYERDDGVLDRHHATVVDMEKPLEARPR